jgi:hypothetical protein
LQAFEKQKENKKYNFYSNSSLKNQNLEVTLSYRGTFLFYLAKKSSPLQIPRRDCDFHRNLLILLHFYHSAALDIPF